jgi:hypothetical protein
LVNSKNENSEERKEENVEGKGEKKKIRVKLMLKGC